MSDRYVGELCIKVSKGLIDRRQFISSAVAAGATLTSAISLADSALAATPKRGGRLRQAIGHGSTTDSLDPATFENGFMQNVVFSYGNYLTEVDNEGKLVPELAESWEASADARTWIFKLRKGVEFHNGKTMTADDVLTSLAYHRGEATKSSAKVMLEPITSMKKDGEDTVVFELSSGNADFPFVLSSYQLLIVPDADGKPDWASGVGTGGYVLKEFEPGVRALLVRNPNYFKPDRAYFDEVETLSITDYTARQTALTSGSVDVIDRVQPSTVALLARAAGIKVLEAAGTQHYTFPMIVTDAPFDNADLRMAIKLMIDREELVKKVLSGHGVVGNDHPISTANRYHASELPQRTQDLDKARSLLRKAGLENAKVQLHAADAAFAGAVDAAVLIADSAAKAGLQVEVVREPNDGYWANVWKNKPWCACYWGGRPTEDLMFSVAYARDAKSNDTDWRTNERFNELLVTARAELDEARRRAMYVEMQTIVSNDGGALVPMFANHIMAASGKLAQPDKIAGNWALDGHKSAERWWFA